MPDEMIPLPMQQTPVVPAQPASKKKVLIISDAASLKHVGQAKVCFEIGKRLMEKFSISQLGFGFGESRPEDTQPCPFPIYPISRPEMGDPKKVIDAIKRVNPDVVLFSHDCWLFPSIGTVRANLPQIKFIGYVTIDGEPIYYQHIEYLKPYDKLISPSHHGARCLVDRWLDLNVDVVPYGLNPNVFHAPKQGKEQLKTDLHKAYMQGSGSYLDLHQKFVGISVGANQDRKNLGLTYEAWKEFEKGKENQVRLLMFVHSASLKDEIGSYDLACFIHDTKTIRIINQVQPDEVIGQFTACADILVHPCCGEGFGLCPLQSMACGTVPIILPFAGLTDYCTSDNTYQVPYITHIGGFHVKRALTSTNNLVAALDQSYKNPEERIKKAINGIETAKNYSWEKCTEGIIRNIEEVLTYDSNSLYFKRLV